MTYGQVIEFTEAEIVNWLYVEGGKMRGNFTACAMLKREPPDQLEAAKKPIWAELRILIGGKPRQSSRRSLQSR